ncbi:LOW QUALITY PROTEIN: NFX1-type zinc finger-containing protein 1-like [Hemicordylus capensis]|uniref:LOW QUALITY PROTEIN: NFX1-type zinc finger-containing protein 1-like n=1 Tax=Hemicordylus capensis TaxID=884348 RepID=UPI00230456EF|nr:LOW QUALITY PROTEIN: NFX1-type zinc finger-containing protein 1-like [Hemicordylus capensis]
MAGRGWKGREEPRRQQQQQQQRPRGGGGARSSDRACQQGPAPARGRPDRPRGGGLLPPEPRGRPAASVPRLHLQPGQKRQVGSGRVVLQDGGGSAEDGAKRSPWEGRSRPAGKRTLGPGGHGALPSGQTPRCRSHPEEAGHSPHHAQHPPRGIGFKFLEDLLQKDASEVAITLACSTGLKEVLSQTAMRPHFLQLLCQALRKACCSRMDRQSIQQLLGAVKESNFLRMCLPQYVVDMQTEATPAVRHQYPEHIGNILALVQELVSVFPASSVQKVAMLMSALPTSVNALRASGVAFPEEVEKSLAGAQAFLQHLQEKKREGTLRVDSGTLLAPSRGGEGEYRTLSIFPTYKEVHGDEKLLLRPNIVSQPYESPAAYLDTHFRLLREDFVRPLREGILQLLQSFEDTGLRKRRFDNVHVYFDVRILVPLCSATGVDYQVQFDLRPLKSVRWENSKRLLYGSLVCMSRDHFETFLFATVSQRDSQELRKGSVCLSFAERSRPLLAGVQASDSFVMVESTAYFEAYRHVLQRLQEIQEDDLPFQRYIVQCEPHVRAPAYLAQGPGSTYDLRCLMTAAGAESSPGGLAGRSVDILDPRQWPSREALGLDESQLQALQLALTKELAIIQGPPGTGKTCVGLKIVEALMSNRAAQEKCPTLIVCYTNHALDQFLEGIYSFRKKGTVRVGSRSSSECVKQFNLQELRRRGLVAGRRGPQRGQQPMREAQQQLEACSALLENSQRGILHERHLRGFMAPRHWDSLRQAWNREWLDPKRSLVLEWLGLGVSPVARGAVEPEEGAHAAGQELSPCWGACVWSGFPGRGGSSWRGRRDSGQSGAAGRPLLGPLLASKAPAPVLRGCGSLGKGDPRLGGRDEAPPPARPQPSPALCLHLPVFFLGPAGQEEEEEEEEEEQAGLLHIAEEADLIQAERLLYSDEPGAASARRKDRRRAAAAELADRLLAMKLEDHQQQQGVPQSAEEAGWEVQQGQKKKMKRKVKAELHKPHALTEAEAEAVRDVWQLDLSARWQLYRHWLQKYQAEIRHRLLNHGESYQSAAERLAGLHLQQDLRILQTAWIVGMTTTGAARYRQVLQEVAPRVIIVEEAAEVLEAHTITTLSSACQHLILIGDHQQLRPSANVYDLAKNFHLEVSLFERLVNVGLPFVRLNFQHRMRPEIAQLLTPHIYQELENHPSVLQYENIKGVSANLFFVEHSFPEEQLQEGRSHQNQHEARFVVALCKYLLCQDYRPSQITILTTYTGQLFCLRKLLPAQTFQGVKVHVVDKYQGEENDIILLSLVRSNLEQRVGFLQISNRICVALSRAKQGLFCIGNMGMLGKVPLWSRISHTLRAQGHIGCSLLLSCQNHPGTQKEVARAADFDRVPEGGCSRPCDSRLDCGHVCPRACHPYDPQHKAFQCLKPCPKELCPEGHRCPRLCWEPCGKCLVRVPKALPRCGHQQQVPCSMPVEEFCCQEPCGSALPCGHRCGQLCGQECTRRCSEMVPATLQCGHSQLVPCSVAAEVRDGQPEPCRAQCPGLLECGHPCPGSCGSCASGRFHQPCRQPCQRLLVCAHLCRQPCGRECPPCQEPCQNRCLHSRCRKVCGLPCVPCREPCEWRCQHYQCSQLCAEPCDRPPCEQPCPKRLPCGHPCAGLCGEPCPRKCLVCHREELTQIFFGFEEEPGARFVQLEDCGHIFEAQGLDCYMEGGGEESEAIKLKVCPSCQTPIRRNLRYGAQVKRSLAQIEEVKTRLLGAPAEIAAGIQRLLEEKAALLGRLPPLRRTLEPPALSAGSRGLVETLLNFYGRLADLAEAASQLAPSEREGAKKRLAEAAGWLERPRLSFSPQELSDLQGEFQRLTCLLHLLALRKAAGGQADPSAAELLRTAQQVLEQPGPFTREDKRQVQGQLEALEAALPKAAGLGISDKERLQIVAAVKGTSRGHWFKCPNGHIYAIGECGGAMQRSRCPDCQEAIGGSNHRLEPSNRLAPEMDGATHAAWSEGANNRLNQADLRRRLLLQ